MAFLALAPAADAEIRCVAGIHYVGCGIAAKRALHGSGLGRKINIGRDGKCGMPIYTKTGDRGTSQLGNGGRVRKDDARIEALGALDELNCALGMANARMKKPDETIEGLQADLLYAGAALSGTVNGDAACKKLEARTKELEKKIDEIEATLPPLKNFILPGGCPAAAELHWARAVARMAERRIVSGNFGVIGDRLLPFFNRISSYLFVRARKENERNGISEKIWKGE